MKNSPRLKNTFRYAFLSLLIGCSIQSTLAWFPLFATNRSQAATSGSETLVASPSDYGFSVPSPKPSLPTQMETFLPPLLGSAQGPAIAEYTRTAAPDNVMVVAGPDFNSQSHFLFYGQTSPTDSALIDRPVKFADNNASTVIVPANLPSWSTYLMWPRNGDLYGRPVAINKTDAWWVGPDKAIAGESISIYGRNLAYRNGTSAAWVYIKPIGNAVGQWVAPSSVNPYKVDFTIPNLPAGTYELWSHNGHGGDFGWSGPLTLTLISQSPFAGHDLHVFDVTAFGAKGNDALDDTAAVNNALSAAGNAAPATVYFPAGTYTINGALGLKNNVSWRGAGRDDSIIKAGPSFATSVPSYHDALIFSEWNEVNNVEFRDLAIDGAGNLNKKNLVRLRNHSNIKFTNIRCNAKDRVHNDVGGSIDLKGNKYVVIVNSEFIGKHLWTGDSKQVVIKNNSFRLTDSAEAAIFSWGGSEVSVSNNTARDYDPTAATIGGVGAGRFFATQSHPDSNRHFYIGDNTTINMSPPANMGDQNRGEQIMFEVGTSMFTASPVSSSSTSSTFSQPLPLVGTEWPDQYISSRDAVIIRGRGAGQTRQVTSVNGKTIIVSPAWAVVPDGTSVIGVGPAQTRSVIYRNSLDGKTNDADHFTGSVGLIMYGNVSDTIFANNTLTDIRNGLTSEFSQVPNWNTSTPSAIYFNLIANNSLNRAKVGIGGYTNFLTENRPGILGHLGNSYRANTLSNITSHGIRFEPDYQGYTGGDFNQNIYEHNVITNVPKAIGVGHIFWSNSTVVNTKFSNLNLYKNTFIRGTASFSGSKSFDVLGNTTNFLRSGNKWIGFQENAVDVVNVSGRVMSATGRGIGNATVKLSDPNGDVRVTTTSAFGYYAFKDVDRGISYTFSVKSRNLAFTGNARTIEIVGETEGINFSVTDLD